MTPTPKLQKAAMSTRFKALFLDWLLISAYLLMLLAVTLTVYHIFFVGIPEFSWAQAQLISAFTSVVPISTVFSWLEGRGNYGSWGKRKLSLRVAYQVNPIWGSIVRNVLKFLPWQFGHMGTIYGLYSGFDSPFSVIFLFLSLSLAVLYILTALIREDHRHLADLIARSMVVQIQVRQQD